MKKIGEDGDSYQESNIGKFYTPTSFQEKFEMMESQIANELYLGSLTCWGIASLGSITQFNQELRYWGRTIQSLCLKTVNGDSIDLPIIFAPFYGDLFRKRQIGRIRYFADSTTKTKNNQFKKANKINSKKHMFKKLIQVRMDVYLNQKVYNEKSPQYALQIKAIENMRSDLAKMKKNTEEHRSLSYRLDELEGQVYFEKVLRGLLLYLIEKTNVKIINRSFVKPPPRMNFMMRDYRKRTIGIITRNARNQYRIQNKIAKWKRTFRLLGTTHPCIKTKNDDKYYNDNSKEKKFIWGQKMTEYLESMQAIEGLKLDFRNDVCNNLQQATQKLEDARKKLMKEMGAVGFDENNDDDEEQNQGTEQQMLKKKNESLMERFEKQNKHFKQHPNPPQFISQLKAYQRQALQWMKYREGKIPVEDLFKEEFIQQIKQFDYQRKLSPFWSQIQLINNEKMFINFLTGEFTQKFHEWKSIKGGILADEMGLGKTVMTLSLLADEKYDGLNLIVVPVSVILQWKDQIKKHCGDDIKVFEFHSNSKSRRKTDLTDYDIVLITYATLGNEYKSYSQNRQEGAQYLFDYNYRRVILDEAQNIKGTKTLQFNGVMNLKSQYSWCLTGTLIQNSEQDLFAIFKFLRVEVFSEQYWWNQYIKNSNCTQAKLNVIQTVLRPIVLRRTKASTSDTGEAIITLKNKQQFIIRPVFSEVEQKIYKKLSQGVKSFFKKNLNSTRNYTHVFQIISKLRQFCCHPALVFGTDAQEIDENDIESALNKFLQLRTVGKQFRETAIQSLLQEGTNCTICMEQPDDEKAVLTECGHFFCEDCIKSVLLKQRNCPICRKELGANSYIKKEDFKVQIPNEIKSVKQSSKLLAIYKVLDEIQARNQKCVIFTQWIPIISMIELRFINQGINFGIIKGNVPVKKRQSIIKKFKEVQDCQFLIVSIKAGGTGLNLAFANNVMICDPWWNPSHEDQAIGRVHRIGQEKDVNVYRFYMKNSIEQKIEKMHETKRKLAEQVMMEKGSLQEKKQGGAEQLIRLLE